MRFSSVRTKSDDRPAFKTADVVLQLGESRIPLKAEKVLGTVVPKHTHGQSSSVEDFAVLQQLQSQRHQGAQCDNSILSRQNTTQSNNGESSPTTEDEARALAALVRMQESLTAGSVNGSGSQRVYWSPDDLSNTFTRSTDSFLPTAIPSQPHRRLTSESYFSSLADQGSSNLPALSSSIRDFADKPPTIFDNVSGNLPSPVETSKKMRRNEDIRRSKTLGPQSGGSKTSKRPRKLDLGQLFAQKSSSHNLSPGGHSKSPSTLTDSSDHLYPTPPTTGSQSCRRPKTSAGEAITLRPLSGKKELEGDIFDPKTNVRRPPKGIQNWFDAYLSEDEEGDDEEESDDEEAETAIPFELPADDIAPPAYDGPNRVQTNRSTDSNNTSYSSASIDRKHSTPSSKQDSVLSMTSSEGDRNSCEAARRNYSVPNSHIAHTATSLPRAYNMRSYSHESLVMHTRDTSGTSTLPGGDNFTYKSARTRDKPLPVPPGDALALSPTSASGSHHGLPFPKQRGSSFSTNQSTHQARHSNDRKNSTYSENHPEPSAAHMMVVTEEEMLLLDLMRRKRAAAAQMSFSEGYEMALRRESNSSHGRSQAAWSPTAPVTAEAFPREPRSADRRSPGRSWTVSVPPNPADEMAMRRQFSNIRKEDVDNALKMERFLSMQAPPVLTSVHPAERPHIPVELPGDEPTNQPGHHHSYSLHSHQHSGSLGNAFSTRLEAVLPEEYDSDSSFYATRTRSKKSRAASSSTYGAPPLSVSAGVAGNSARRPSARASIPPSPVPEEDPLMAGSAGAASLEDIPRQSLDRVVMRDDPRMLPIEIQLVAQMLARENEASQQKTSQPASDYSEFLSVGPSGAIAPPLARSASAASYLSRQDSTKHLAHLRPEVSGQQQSKRRPEITVPVQQHRYQQSGDDLLASPLSKLTGATITAPAKHQTSASTDSRLTKKKSVAELPAE